jgi:hypothetical protein
MENHHLGTIVDLLIGQKEARRIKKISEITGA